MKRKRIIYIAVVVLLLGQRVLWFLAHQQSTQRAAVHHSAGAVGRDHASRHRNGNPIGGHHGPSG